MYWNVCVASKYVWISCILFDARRDPLKTSVSKKTKPLDNISYANLIVIWNSLAKSTKLPISCLLEVHTEKTLSMNPFQIIDFCGLARSNCFPKLAI